MDYGSEKNGARTDSDQSETLSNFRVSYESQGNELVRGHDGRLYIRVPTPWEEVWWFDRQWNSVPDPRVKPEPVDLLAMAHSEADKERGPAKCYFIGGDEGPVKIGYSIDVTRRMRDLQMASPVRLKVLAIAPGGMLRENAYHMQFDDFRLHGEWFERCPEILAEIDRLSAAPRPLPTSLNKEPNL